MADRYPPLRNLRAEMARSGLSSSDIAAAAGVAPSRAGRWLRGASVPSVHDAIAIASKLFDGLTIEYLFKE